MTIGIYARVSTSQQTDNTSLDEQVKLCKEKVIELGFHKSKIKIYREEGRSGEDINTRLIFKEMRKDMANDKLSVVICTHPDRLSRSMLGKLTVCEEIKDNNVELFFTDAEFKNDINGKFYFNLLSSIAEYELDLIKKRTTRGRLSKVKNEKKIMPMRIAPFGYDKSVDGQLIVHQQEKQYVQMIYEWYVIERLTLREIGGRLYKMGVKPKRAESSNWSASSISRILTSKIYIGKYYYNRRATKKVKGAITAGGNPKKTYEFRPEEEWLEIDIPPIVDEELWNQAQQQRDKNSKNKHVGSKKYEYLLKSILKCGHCGRTYDATTYSGRKDAKTGESKKYRSYRCPNKFPRKYGPEISKCKVPTVKAEEIEGYLWDKAVEIITDPEKFIVRLQNNNDDSLKAIRDRILQFEKDLTKKKRALERVDTAYFEAEDNYDLERYKIRRDDYKKEIKAIELNVKNDQDKIDSQKLHDLTVEQMTQVIEKFKEMLSDVNGIDFKTKRDIILMLFDEIILTFGDDEELNVTSVGLFNKLYSEIDVGVSSQRQKV
ncbi:recombinase family protein [Salipaludibacillus sp. CF4.18]|uniref:recombinase family protein n=1 Tax=Salipaludibacillus sp. CF4.18 TaxID=3373081 RepID=UPI003EE433D0